MTIFNFALKYVLENEGGYSNDEHDAGGPTNLGITQADLSRWLKRPASVQEVKDLSGMEAGMIYESYYWIPLHCNAILDRSIATCIFDIGVNRGISVGARYAQIACNALGSHLVVDAQIGPKTLGAINSVNPKKFIIKYACLVMKGYATIAAKNPSQLVFIEGWLNRAEKLFSLMDSSSFTVNHDTSIAGEP